jgi:hypothetical protein
LLIWESNDKAFAVIMQPEIMPDYLGTKKGANAPFYVLIKVFKQKNFLRSHKSDWRLDYEN